MTASTLGYTPGTGAQVATDVQGGAHHQKAVMEFISETGVVTPVTPVAQMPVDASYGELIGAVEALRFAVAALTKTIGYALPNAAGQPIMEVRQATAGSLNATVSGTVTANIGSGTLSALSTLTNQTQIGGFAANDQIPALMHLSADNLRRNITVT
jgi:hypothetical protein